MECSLCTSVLALPQAIVQRLLPILANLPCAVTLLDLDSGPVYQNGPSLRSVIPACPAPFQTAPSTVSSEAFHAACSRRSPPKYYSLSYIRSHPFSFLCKLRSYYGNHSDAFGSNYRPSFTTGYDLLVALLERQPEVTDQLLEHFLEGRPFKKVWGAVILMERTTTCSGYGLHILKSLWGGLTEVTHQ